MTIVRSTFWHHAALLAAIVGAGTCASAPVGASAAVVTFVTGVVTADGKPVADLVVSISGNNTVERTRTDARGRFAFGNLTIGAYTLSAAGPLGSATQRIDLGSAGAGVALELRPSTIGNVVTVRGATASGAGTDLTLNAQQLARSPAGGNFPNLLVQLPGAARGANGVVHVNGDHGDISYIVDGVAIPQELNRIIGSEFDTSDVGFMEVLEGAYPARYGERFAAVLNINTITGSGSPGGAIDLSAGSFAHADSRFSYHTTLGSSTLVLAARNERSNRATDPPDFDSPHNDGSDANQFVRYTLPNGNDFLNLTLSHSYRTNQIPNDVAGGEPATTDDNETQDDLFAALQYRHAIGDRGALSFGPAFKRSRIRDFGDPGNDYAYGTALNLGAGGSPTDCADALLPGGAPNPAVAFGPQTCGYSLTSDRTALDYRFNVDYALRSAAHEIRIGAVYGMTNVSKRYGISLQPGNFLSGLLTPATPNAPYTVVDSTPNVGHAQEAYLEDAWRMGADWELDYGLRFDAFQIFSTQFSDGAAQFSPRLKLTRLFGPRASAYIYYGRFFTPFSLENVAPLAASLLNLPLQPTLAQFDLKPQRDSDYEIGGRLPLGGGLLGMRIMAKNATDLIDDTQVGVTNLHQDINYAQGRIATQSMYYQIPLPRDGRFYLSLNHTYSVNKGCETQLLAPCFGSPTDWTPADHEQRWGSTAGLIANDRRGGWFSVDGEYGSGLSSAACPAGTPGFCKYTPHVTFDLSKGVALGPQTVLTLRIGDIFNDRYLITYQNAQGNHYASGRTFDLGVRWGAERPAP
jgi:hypothetical protein